MFYFLVNILASKLELIKIEAQAHKYNNINEMVVRIVSRSILSTTLKELFYILSSSINNMFKTFFSLISIYCRESTHSQTWLKYIPLYHQEIVIRKKEINEKLHILLCEVNLIY